MRYQFEEFELDLDGYEVRRRGEVVWMGSRAFDLVAHLIRHRDRVVPKEELLGAIWGEVSVGESTLTRCVSLARQALSDTPSKPRIIKTVHGRGYRFVAPVSEVAGEVSRSPAASTGEVEATSAEDSTAAPTRRGTRGQLPFVGREEEMAQLEAHLGEALEGRGRLILLAGEAGIGKTRLTEELAQIARARGARVRIGRCSEDEGAPALWPWMQVIRSELEEFGPRRFQSVVGSAAPHFALLLPELAGTIPHLLPPPTLAPAEIRFWLSDSIARFLTRIAAETPLLLVLDDLQRADQRSLSLLQFLASGISDTPMLCVGAYRDTDLQQDSERAGVFAELARQGITSFFPLRGLSPSAIGRLLELVTGRTATPDQAERLHEESGGNPFFLTQLIPPPRTTAHTRPSTAENRSQAPVARGMADAILRQLSRVSPDCRQLLTLAAVFGKDFDVMALATASGTKTEKAFEILDEAERAGLVVEALPHVGRCRFAHVLVREALYQELGASERARLHLRAGEALEETCTADAEARAAEVAHHYLRSLPIGDPLRAIDCAMRAGAWAAQRLSYEEAVRHFTAALRVPNSEELLSDARRCDLLLALEEALARAGDRKAAKATCVDAVALARRLGDPERLARAALGVFPNLFSVGPGVDSAMTRLLEEALEALSDRDDPRRVQIMGRLSLDFGLEISAEERLERSQDAVVIAQRIGDPGTLAFALSARHFHLWGPEETKLAPAMATEIVRLAERSGDRALSLMYRLYHITHLLERGEKARLDLEIASFAREGRELQQPQALCYTLMLQGMQALMEGRLEAAEQHRSRLLQIAVQIEDGIAIQGFAAQMVVGSLEQGRSSESLPALESYVREWGIIAIWRACLAWAYTMVNRINDARREFEVLAARDFSSVDRNMLWLCCIQLLGDVCYYLGDVRRAECLYQLLLPYANMSAVAGFSFTYLGSVARVLGLLATTLGRFEDAEDHLEDAIEREFRVGATPWAVRALQDQARMLLARGSPGDRDRARAAVDRALQGALALGLEPMISALHSLGAECEARQSHTSLRPPGTLTK